MAQSATPQSTRDTSQEEPIVPKTQSYVSMLRDLVKSSGIYAVSSLAAPLIALVLAPFLTHALSVDDYGALVVLNTAITLLTGITQLGMISAVFRAYNYDFESQQDRWKVLSTTIILLLLTSIPLALIFFLAAPWISNVLLNSPVYSDSIKISAIVILIQNLSVPGLSWLRAESKAAFFTVLSVVNLLVALGANILLIGTFHLGINGSLLATGLGYSFIVICTLPLILLRAGLRTQMNIVRNLISFGIPLVFNTVSFWVLQLSDRYLLSRLGSLAATASYGVAYSLGSALNVVILAPFALAWPMAMFAIAKKDDAPAIFQFVFRWLCIVLLLAAFSLTLVAEAVLTYLFPPSYHSAQPVIPIVALSIVFYGVYTIFTVGTGIQRKTWYIALTMTLAAVINVAANFVLIPLYGSIGAAVSTLIAYFLLTIVMYFVNQRIYPLPFEIGLLGLATLLGIGLYIGSTYLAQQQTFTGASAIYVGTTVLYAGCLFMMGKFAARQARVQKA